MKPSIPSSISRRRALSLGLGLVAGAEIESLPFVHAQPKRATFVLVHGAWHGGWCWRRVVDRLTAKGHYVVAPTLSGVGERSHLPPDFISLTTQINDVIGEIKWKDLEGIVLVGHSYGGMVITGVAEQLGDRIASIVYIDAFTPADGQSLLDNALARCRTDRSWKTETVTCGHDVMIDQPAQLCATLERLG